MRSKIFLITLLSLILFSSCKNKNNNSIDNAYIVTLDSLIHSQSAYYHKITKNSGLALNYVDSIIIRGNELLDNINKNKEIPFTELVFLNSSNNYLFDISKVNLENYAEMIKLMQLCAIKDEINSFFQSHYQVEMLGLIPLNSEVAAGKHETIRLLPHYLNIDKKNSPIFFVGEDTLFYDGTYYYYEAYFDEVRDTIIARQFKAAKWGDTLSAGCGFRLEVIQ